MKKFKTESKRICAMLNLSGVTEQSATVIEKYIGQTGMQKVLDKFNLMYDTNLQVGEYIIQSKANKGFWSNDFGWSISKEAASGFTEEDLSFYKDKKGVAKPNFHNVPDAQFVLYETAKNFKS